MPTDLDKLCEANDRLTSLLKNPEPGLMGWQMMLSQTLQEFRPFIPEIKQESGMTKCDSNTCEGKCENKNCEIFKKKKSTTIQW